MTRIACAWLPRFELALLARLEGADLWRQPVAIADLSAALPVVREATPAAERSGVLPGMTVAQARVRCGGLSVRPPATEARAAAEARVLAALAPLAPQLASDGRGAFFLGLAGMARLIDDESAYAARVAAAVRRLGFAASVGVAGHPFAAWIAARRGVGPIAPGSDARFLASVPLADLELSEPARSLLALLGVRTAGQVARLPRGALGRRLGAEGDRLERLCRGELLPAGTVPTAARVPRAPASAALDLEGPVEGLEPLLFLVKGLLDRLLAGVAAERRAIAELAIEAELDDGSRSRVVHRLAPAEPTLDARRLVDLVRLWLDGRPLAAPPRSLRVVASKVAPAPAHQLGLYARRQEEGEAALERALARLAAAFGEEAVARPALADRFRPEARVAWTSARGGSPAARARAGRAAGTSGWTGAGRARTPARSRRAAGPGREAGEGGEAASAGGLPWDGPALRLLADPEPVELTGGTPRRLLRRGEAPRRIVRIEAVQRVSGEWWDAPFDRTYAWVVCEGGERFWLFHDHLRGGTFLHAVAD